MASLVSPALRSDIRSQAGPSPERLRTAISLAYEAAVDPSRWTLALDRLAEAAGGRGALLFSPSHVGASYHSPGVAEVDQRYVAEQWWLRNPRTAPLARNGTAKFVGDRHLLRSVDEVRTEPYYRDLLAPAGLRFCARTILHSMPDAAQIVLSIERESRADHYSADDLESLDAVRPDLVSVARLAELAGFRALRTFVAGWDMLERACVLLGPDGKVLSTTAGFAQIPGDILSIGRAGLKAASTADNRKLAERFAGAARRAVGKRTSDAGPVVLHRPDGSPGVLVEMLPLREHVSELFSGAAVLVVATDMRRPAKAPVAALATVFKLTPSESRIVARLVAGDSVADTADSLKLSRETIRTQLKSAFAKCGVSRQSELVLLATRMAP